PWRPGLAAIEVHQVSKRFGEVRAVSGVSFTIERGSICALLGANGAGKTTTLAMLLGLVTPITGSIRCSATICRAQHGIRSSAKKAAPFSEIFTQRLLF
ncbi:MAG: ATP-binding cassette domain-containing protein, partial [Gammaproteobacteria bacterium]